MTGSAPPPPSDPTSPAPAPQAASAPPPALGAAPERPSPSGRIEAAWQRKVFRWVLAIALVLMAIDVGALTILLRSIDIPYRWAIPIAAATGALSTYKAQFSHLLSKGAFAVHRSPGRHLFMAVIVLALNGGLFWLVAKREYLLYLVLRILLAVVVIWAWGMKVGPKLLGDGKAALNSVTRRRAERT